MNARTAIIAFLLMMIAVEVHAGTIGPVQIVGIKIFKTGASLKFSPALTVSSCNGSYATSYVDIRWESIPDSKLMFTTALTALTTGYWVQFATSGCSPGGPGSDTWGGPLESVYRVDISPNSTAWDEEESP